MVEDTTRLLGLAGLAVVGVADGAEGPVVDLVTADERARWCPECGTPARRSKGRRVTRPRDLPVGGRRPALRWCKRRWRCDEPSCRRGSFTEAVPVVPARKRLTGRLREAAGAAVADGGRTVVQSARDHDVSWPVVAAAFAAHAAAVLPVQPQPVEVLGIDEIRRGRPKFVFDEESGAWQSTVDRWHVGFVDLSHGQGLLGQVEGRTAKVVADWLLARPPAWRDQVRYVAIDMCTVFKSAVGQVLPHAQLVVDHFHLVQLANATVTEVRRRVTVQVRGRRGRKGNREWELRNRLTRSAARMRAEHVDDLQAELTALPARIGRPILAAWNAKEDLLDLLALARTKPDRERVAVLLDRFYRRCANADLPELERLATTVQTWWPQILAFIRTGITNAGSEGTNRVIKTVARDAYGFRNPINQRLRTRCATTRRTRGHLNPR
ncbi:ISL3 family transposase [Micromonospora zhanjiangensis]|uniref:ISL3 family transposase n=1 Tax=Micromonospora zhanjiangensis TaxID=1522057 RepID=A0ABV8KXK3_9ACTN